MQVWTTTADGKTHCPKHNHTWGPLEAACPCTPPPVTREDDTGITETDRELDLLFIEARSQEKKWARVASELLDGTDSDKHLATKVRAEATKLKRYVTELAIERKKIEHARWLVAQDRKRRRGSN